MNNDLISRSALLEKYQGRGFIFESIVRLSIEEAPTIDAEPVRHGEWTPKKVGAITTEFECSECGRTVTLTNDYFGKATNYASSYYPYCHCGAKMMDAEVQDG